MHDQASLEWSRAYLGGLSVTWRCIAKVYTMVSALYHFTPDLEMAFWD